MTKPEPINTSISTLKMLFFDQLNDQERKLIEENSNLVSYHKGDVVFRQNTLTSHIMIVSSGMVKIYKEARNNKVLILKILCTNSFLGLISVYGDEIHQFSASAIEETEVYHIDHNIFKGIVLQNGSLATLLMKEVSKSGLYIFDRLMSQYQKQLPGRIADVILYFSQIIYKKDIFEFPLTRRELAELAGTTKESFIRTLTEFKNDRIIKLDGKKVEISSMQILKTLSKLG